MQSDLDFTAEEEEKLEVKTHHALCFVVFASSMLLLMFYFYEYFQIFLLIYMAFSSIVAICLLLDEIYKILYQESKFCN